MVDALTASPAMILGVPGGRLEEGGPADLTIVDPEAAYTVDPEAFFSKGRNTPFAGRELRGRAVATMVEGRFVFRDGEPEGRTGEE
jgi:dihydroorotase